MFKRETLRSLRIDLISYLCKVPPLNEMSCNISCSLPMNQHPDIMPGHPWRLIPVNEILTREKQTTIIHNNISQTIIQRWQTGLLKPSQCGLSLSPSLIMHDHLKSISLHSSIRLLHSPAVSYPVGTMCKTRTSHSQKQRCKNEVISLWQENRAGKITPYRLQNGIAGNNFYVFFLSLLCWRDCFIWWIWLKISKNV